MGFFGRYRKNCALPKVLHASGKFLLPPKFVSLIIWFVSLIILIFILVYPDAVWDPSLMGICPSKFPAVHDFFMDIVKFWAWDIPSYFTEGKQRCQACEGKWRKMRHLTVSSSCEKFSFTDCFRGKKKVSYPEIYLHFLDSFLRTFCQMQVWQPQTG